MAKRNSYFTGRCYEIRVAIVKGETVFKSPANIKK
jgi:hypothetical protein